MAFTKTNLRNIGCVGLAFASLIFSGCGGSKDDTQPGAVGPSSPFDGAMLPPPPGNFGKRATSQGSLDFTGLKGVLAGKWQEADDSPILNFTEKSVEEAKYTWSKHVGKYVVKGDLITFTDRDGDSNVYGLEFVSDGEIALRPERLRNGTDFNDLSGRWRRISLPPNRSVPKQESGPIADAKRQVQKIEQKLAKNESILKSALADRDEYAAKLRALGVNSATDLKGNVRGQRLAENLVKLANEIDGLERHLAVIDTELLKAKSIVRRMEQEEAGLSEADMRSLSQQLREAEERTNGNSLPVTPLDVDAAVEKALKGLASSKKAR